MARTDKTPKPEKKKDPTNKRTGLYIGSVIVFILATVTFIGAPAIGGSMGAGTSARLQFGSYRGRPIEYIQGNFFERQLRAIAEQQNQAGSEDLESQLYWIWRQAFESAAVHTAIMYYAERGGMDVSDDRVDSEMAGYPAFLENGRFSTERYQSMPAAERFSLRTYIEEVLIHQQFLEDMIGDDRHSSAEVAFLQEMAQTERRFSFVSFAFDDFPDEEVLSYGETNSDLFRRINLSSITINTSRSDAEEVHRQAVDGVSSFEELARTHSADIFAEQGGEMGWEYYYDLEPDFDSVTHLDEVFSLRAGEISPVLQTRTGYVIYRVNEPAQTPNFEESTTIRVIRDYMETFARGQIEDYAYDRAAAFAESANDVGFNAAAEQHAAIVERTEFFPLNYQGVPFLERPRGADGADLDNAASLESFFRTAFSLGENETSEPLVLRNKVMVLNLHDERTASTSTLGTIETFFGNYLQNFQQQDLQRTLMSPDYLEDNFNEVFFNRILG
ncbi:MAG: hypothetical protein EA428_01225 [Spirochaetaceae bacterium]|nr:MAG: hypothetical protein EA428_01225 [Spirochaetaceae bacterium]